MAARERLRQLAAETEAISAALALMPMSEHQERLWQFVAANVLAGRSEQREQH